MLYESNYLEHHGIKGQKWGMRRYRNEDGSLTSEGRDHYGIGDPRRPSATGSNQSSVRKAEHNYRVNKFGSASAKILEKKPKQLSEQEQKKDEDLKKQKRRDMWKKIGIGLGATALTAIAAHAVSKNIKNKAISILSREHSKELDRIVRQHDALSKNVSNSGYGTDAVNRILDDLRGSTNAKLNAQLQYRDYRRNKNNKSTLESLRYIRAHR